jgi:hypothetical protein
MSLMLPASTVMMYKGHPNTKTYRKKQEAEVHTACEIKFNQCFQHRYYNCSDLIFLPAHKEETCFLNHVVLQSGPWVMGISQLVCMLSMKLEIILSTVIQKMT